MKNSKSTTAKKVIVSNEKLNALTALGITESIKEKSAKKTVFKAEFNNKQDRSKCRSLLLNAVQLFLLHDAHNKADLALEQLNKIKEVCAKYYVAETTFKVYSDYCTENLDALKKEQLKAFINIFNSEYKAEIKEEKKAVKPRAKKVKAEIKKEIAPITNEVEADKKETVLI